MKSFMLIAALFLGMAAPISAADRLPGWRIRRAADNAAAAAANANRLVLDAQRQLDALQAQGYVELELDLTVNPPGFLKSIASVLGFDGKITIKAKIPSAK